MKLGAADACKRWTDYDERITADALSTGRLPDGRSASQNRLARYLGFSRQTIVSKLKGRKFPLPGEAMRDGARLSHYVRKVRRAVATLQVGARVRG